MAGCGQCPDGCNCFAVDAEGNPIEGNGSVDSPFVIPSGPDWEGTSPDESITITPGGTGGHAPELSVNWCQSLDCATERDSGSVLICPEEGDEDCRPKSMRPPVDGEFMGKAPDGNWGPVSGVLSTAGVPSGAIMFWPGPEATIDPNWLLCYGQYVDVVDYPGIFGVIGFLYSPGQVDPGDGTFRLPGANGRALIGADDMGGVAAGVVTGATLTAFGGTQDVTLGLSQIPSHSHTISDPGHVHTGVAHTHTITDPGHDHAVSGTAVFEAGHTHEPGSAGRTFITADLPITVTAVLENPGGATRVIVSSADDDQKNNDNTDSAGGHSHVVTGTAASDVTGITVNNATAGVNSASTGVSALNNGGGLAHSNMPPWLALNVIIKI